jgi:hypothetical protein
VCWSNWRSVTFRPGPGQAWQSRADGVVEVQRALLDEMQGHRAAVGLARAGGPGVVAGADRAAGGQVGDSGAQHTTLVAVLQEDHHSRRAARSRDQPVELSLQLVRVVAGTVARERRRPGAAFHCRSRRRPAQ